MKFFWILFLSALSFSAPLSKTILTERPKLVVVIVIDQFRADFLMRLMDRFLPAKKSKGEVGGFRYLISQGAYFPYCDFGIIQNMTAPGHATILTGSYPYQSGVALNHWFDRSKNQPLYCVEDSNSPIVAANPLERSVRGISPKNLIGTTVGDELKNAGYPSKVVSLAIKDRAAVLLGGHRADFVFWFETHSFQWVSSGFYFPSKKLPPWIQKLRSPEKNEATTDQILASIHGVKMTFSLAETAVTELKLGKGKSTDLLAIGLSSHDYLGHDVGPNAPEIESLTLEQDQEISKFLNFLKQRIPGGLSQVTFVVTADHGIAPLPEWLAKERIASARLNEPHLTEELNGALTKQFGSLSSGQWILRIAELNIFLNPSAIVEKKLERKMVEQAIRTYLIKNVTGFAHVITESDVLERHLPPGLLEKQILATYFPGRSGDIIIIPRPFFITGEDKAAHLTGYSYDRTVPLIMTGPHIKSGIYATEARVVDIAPTLTFLLGTIPPPLSEGRVLDEILK